MPFSMYPATRWNCSLETKGPTVVLSEVGSPTTTAVSAIRLAMASTAAILDSGTSMRVGALQDWPEFWNTCSTLCFTARSKSASSSSTFGDLPPNSWCTRLTDAAALRATSVPARVDPVNDTMSTSRCDDKGAPTPGPSPLMRLNTPAGTPASCITFAHRMALNGEYSDGLSTMVQPAASAGTTFAATWFMGQFHGVMRAQTPTGSCTSRVVPRNSSNLKLLSTSIMALMWHTPMRVCEPLASEMGAPISLEMAWAI